MKKVVSILMLVILATTFAIAMDDPITVKTKTGDEVRISVWPVPSGPLLNLDYGIADEDGIFQTTFFSLMTSDVKYRIVINREGEKVQDETFENLGTNNPLNFDCMAICKYTAVDLAPKEVVEVVENTTEEINVIEEVPKESRVAGNSIFVNDDNTIKWAIPIGSLLGLFFITGVIFMLVLHKKNPENKRRKESKIKAPKFIESKDATRNEKDEKLDKVERKVQETEEKINALKAEKEKVKKIKENEQKLKKEEQELQKLEEESMNS